MNISEAERPHQTRDDTRAHIRVGSIRKAKEDVKEGAGAVRGVPLH